MHNLAIFLGGAAPFVGGAFSQLAYIVNSLYISIFIYLYFSTLISLFTRGLLDSLNLISLNITRVGIFQDHSVKMADPSKSPTNSRRGHVLTS